LRGIDLVPGGFEIEERCTVDFGKFGMLSRFGGPFHGERVAAYGGGIEITLHRPGVNGFAGLLFDGGEGDEFA